MGHIPARISKIYMIKSSFIFSIRSKDLGPLAVITFSFLEECDKILSNYL